MKEAITWCTGAHMRRQILARGALLVGGVVLWPAMLMSRATAQSKMSKSQASYQDSPKGDQRCSNCVHFIAEQKACKLVEGEISPQAWCRLWKRAP